MTQHEHAHPDSPIHQHGQHGGQQHGHDHGGHQHHDESGLADLLDLDASVLADYLDDLTAWVAGHAPDARSIIDVGAGTGTGSLALARRFGEATVLSIDRSASMLERVRAAAHARGLDGRIRPVRADLDEAWPDIDGVDLAWAVSSLHELAAPGRVLRDIHGALKPGGLLAVVEMDALPRFLPADIGIGRPGLEERCHEVVAAQGWNEHPDWSGPLRDAGYDVVARHRFDLATAPVPEGTGAYAAAYLGRIREFLAEHLAADDLATLDRLLDPLDEAGLVRRSDLRLAGSRTAWLARKA